MNRSSYTGIVIYIFRAKIIWYSKNQNTVASSMFGSKIVAMRTGMELTKSLCYKLRMMGVPIDGPTSVFCDNKLVVASTYVPTSTLSKNHLGIYYHAVREAVAEGIHRISHIAGEFNLANILTKILMAAVKWPHIRWVLY